MKPFLFILSILLLLGPAPRRTSAESDGSLEATVVVSSANELLLTPPASTSTVRVAGVLAAERVMEHGADPAGVLRPVAQQLLTPPWLLNTAEFHQTVNPVSVQPPYGRLEFAASLTNTDNTLLMRLPLVPAGRLADKQRVQVKLRVQFTHTISNPALVDSDLRVAIEDGAGSCVGQLFRDEWNFARPADEFGRFPFFGAFYARCANATAEHIHDFVFGPLFKDLVFPFNATRAFARPDREVWLDLNAFSGGGVIFAGADKQLELGEVFSSILPQPADVPPLRPSTGLSLALYRDDRHEAYGVQAIEATILA